MTIPMYFLENSEDEEVFDCTLHWKGYSFVSQLIYALIAHSIGRGVHLYHNLSSCFDSTLHWKGRSFVSEFF